MFGYINVYKEELKIRDYNMFRAYYCGLCKSLGKRYNQLVRFGLSYDMTFLAILADSLTDGEVITRYEGCIKHIARHCVCTDNKFIDYCSDVSIILYYYKLSDDIKDEKSLRAFLARLAYIKPVKSASGRYPELAKFISSQLRELSLLETSGCDVIDMAAHPFALLCEQIFAVVSPGLSRLGYNLGRLIYMLDALNDVKKDIDNKSYNPYIAAYGKDFAHCEDLMCTIRGSINMTLSAVAREYSELEIVKNKNIIDNIVYLGLRYSSDSVMKKLEGNNEKSI